MKLLSRVTQMQKNCNPPPLHFFTKNIKLHFWTAKITFLFSGNLSKLLPAGIQNACIDLGRAFSSLFWTSKTNKIAFFSNFRSPPPFLMGQKSAFQTLKNFSKKSLKQTAGFLLVLEFQVLLLEN